MQEINIKEEVYKCSKCGLCQSVCPVFIAAKNELYLPRGRFNLLNNFYNNKKTLSKKFFKDLDICLNCNACKDFCPSNINSAEIFTQLKSTKKINIIPFSLKYKLILLMHSIKKYFVKDKLYNVNIKKDTFYPQQKIADVVYFQGCFNKYINPSDKNAVLNLLKQNGYNVVKIIDGCCGLAYLSGGELNKFSKNAKKIKKSIPKNAAYIITSCDSCYKTLKNIFEKEKLKRIDELIYTKEIGGNFVFHKPYSRENYEYELAVINKKGSCSLMENYFMLKHENLAKQLIDSVFYDKQNINCKTVVTSCNLSKWGLIEGFKKKGINANVISLAEYIALKK